ncbi:MAG: hypothetical protein A2452_02395 [Candidatus Firestonebacteria bacterium RIFOXYC2_FULL_39_67]|nr:MAG: hypothetical protein A2536_01935 [Candidatus Firestonebacteria bacterium RIFOXYD2_FULL_39_29]OGF55172.1 MAG: hypothetical protein A2452_02395 [Candidatus Firestonebacteria bacterium RIFOXYC2_FULL_39_67]
MYLLGLDIGTTNWKANLYDLKGRLIISVSHPAPVKKDKSGNSYYDANQMWKIFCVLIRQAVIKVKNPELIKAISFASMAEAGCLADENGLPLTHIIPWFDKRTIPMMKKILRKISKKEIFGITGVNLTHIFSICKIIWFKEHERIAFKKAAKWVCVPDYLIKRISGEWATDYSIASRTALFDIKNKKWSKKMLDFAGIKESFLPKAFPSGTFVGNVTEKASKECGLSINTKVVLGGHDHVCGSLGAGLFSEGKALDSMGTAESICVPLENIDNLNKYFNSGFSFGCYTFGSMYYAMAGLYYSGGIIEWLMREYYETDQKKSKIYKTMIKDAKGSKPGSNGLYVLPHWLGIGAPYGLREAKGMIIGFHPDTTKGDLINAAYEGLAYEYRLLIETAEKTVGFKAKEIIVIGGGAKNKLWLKRKADILGRTLTVPEVSESVCFGAALLAGLGSNTIKDPVSFVNRNKKELIKAGKKLKDFYNNEYLNHYMRIYRQNLPYWKNKTT